MPINETEQHPFLQVGEEIKANRMIVGTFPIYSLTNPRTIRKQELQQQRGDISFFCGSRANAFWKWYRQYVDPAVIIDNPGSLLTSLRNHEIAISDVIRQCSRMDESFEDSKLRKKTWNTSLAIIIAHSVEKILCTSKGASGAMGWLSDKILIPSGFHVNQAAPINCIDRYWVPYPVATIR